MSIERDNEQLNQQPTDKNQNQQPTGQANQQNQSEFAQQPTGQAREGQGEAGSQPSMAGQQQQPSGLAEGGDTMTEQKSDIESEQTGDEGQSGQFVGSERKDSGDYLRKDDSGESTGRGEGSSENFGNNGE